jgi:hypothetical protein
VVVELALRRVSLAVAEAGPLGMELMRALSLDEIAGGVDGFGDVGIPVNLGTFGFATAHSASRFLRLAA